MKMENNKIFSEIISRLVPVFNPKQIILFGSRAWGTPHESSDYDVLVTVDQSDLSPTKRASKAYLSLMGMKAPVEVIVSTIKELERFKDVEGSLTHKILEKGQIIYG